MNKPFALLSAAVLLIAATRGLTLPQEQPVDGSISLKVRYL
jgi:hypothetical protein